MADVFISYHRSESASALVRRIVRELEGMGISCWYDTKDPKLGYFARTITDEIEQCKVFLLLWDEGANTSRYCISETHYAFSYAKSALIVPFQVGTFQRKNELLLYVGPNQIIFGGKSPEAVRTDELIQKITAEFNKTSAKIIQRGYCGDNVTYTLDKNGVLTISGEGPIENCGFDNAPWAAKRKMISRARILNGVTSIGAFAFHACANLASVDIPDSVTSIGAGAFARCAELVNVRIPYGVTSIGKGAFTDCAKLTSVDIPKSVTSIAQNAFRNCVGLASLAIPESVTSIEASAFADCTGLASVDIPDSVTSIGYRTFSGCLGLKSVHIPYVTSIAKYAFANCWNLKIVDVSEWAEIKENAFPPTTKVIRTDPYK